MFSKTITTLNIEASSVRLLSYKGKHIQAWASKPLPPGAVRDTLIADPKVVASAIEDLFISTGVSKSDVIVSLTGLRSVSRITALPKLRAKQMKEAIRWAARREIPIPTDDLYLSWQTISRQDGEVSIFLLGTPRSLVDTTLRTLRKAGITPHSMDLKPLALARIANKPNAIIIDLENDSTSFLILVDGIPQMMHTMILPQEELILEDIVLKLIADLSRALTFYNNAHPEQPVSATTPVLITGELAVDPNAAALIQKEILYPVEPAEPEVKCFSQLPCSQYAVNIGMVLSKMPGNRRKKLYADHPRPVNLNILPPEYRTSWRNKLLNPVNRFKKRTKIPPDKHSHHRWHGILNVIGKLKSNTNTLPK